MTARKLAADDVCAFCWMHLNEGTRGALCALARVSTPLALLEWYELTRDHQAALKMELADLIEHNASRQRAEWLPAGSSALCGALATLACGGPGSPPPVSVPSPVIDPGAPCDIEHNASRQRAEWAVRSNRAAA